MCILPILAKWTLIGRWKPQQIRVWSLKYFRFWLVKTLVRLNPLVLFAGSTSSADLAKSIQWSGQGSLSPTGARVAARVGRSGPANTDEVEVSIDGLVSGRIEFAGPPDAGSSASRVTHWLAAAQSADPPGIRDGLPNLRSPDVTGQ